MKSAEDVGWGNNYRHRALNQGEPRESRYPVARKLRDFVYKCVSILYNFTMIQKTVSEARESFAEVLATVNVEPVEIFRHGVRVAVIVSPTMYDKSVEALEDKADEEASDAVDRDDTIPWDEIKSELGLA